LGTVDQLDGAVVAQQQGPGDLADGRPIRVGMAADGQQQLVLGWGEPGRSGLLGAPQCRKRRKPVRKRSNCSYWR
jgi:hypothetical protein